MSGLLKNYRRTASERCCTISMMTEEEAKKKWCPMAFPGGMAGCNRAMPIDDGEARSLCIGSKCMAWRWSTEVATNSDSAGEFKFNPAPGPNDKDNLPRGYCGAFGRPDQ